MTQMKDDPAQGTDGNSPSAANSEPGLGESFNHLLRALGREGQELLKDASTALADGLRQGLDMLAADPKVGPTAVDDLMKIVPVLSGMKIFADAREKYTRAKTEGDASLLHQARQDCLLACLSSGLDLGTFGIAAASSPAATGALLVAAGIKAVGTVEGVRKEVVDPCLDYLLKKTGLVEAMDKLLQFVPPTTAQGEPAVSL